MYNALKGDEFDAIAKNSKNAEKEQLKPRPFSARPRTSWVPSGVTTTSLDYQFVPTPIVQPKAVTFPKSARKSALLEDTGAHDKRFSFNPNEYNFFTATRYRPFPVTNFDKQLPRDGKTFTVPLTLSEADHDFGKSLSSIFRSVIIFSSSKCWSPFRQNACS